MKKIKINLAEKLAILTALLFLAALGGYMLGVGHVAGDYSVQTEKLPAAAEQSPEISGSDDTHFVDGCLDLNAASKEELMDLPGIGEVLAERILNYREEHGGFSSTEEIMQVSGIGEKVYAEIEDYITVGGQK